ncbi:GNAT family N-acetyltransferase [Stenotrophomonas maltophilia]|uniref:GNAT family N-acetyltransferase n=1 Tax=Stenotrophomonas sp. RAC2 TaxID=3064902 RepID=UPI001312F9A3|nr:N-acetyltransferase [Stenotrophomonas sp. RAC2]MBH1430582.1 GNAT family N-acetyltransferase [Stenotrophomonas maltophilia]MDV9044034.1 N-acetyltransferase [Stenotrophomonas sp. RAC2]
MSAHPGNTGMQAWGGFSIRPLRPDDLDLICAHREAMFRESGRNEELLQQMAAPFRGWLAPRLASGDYFGFILGDQQRPIAGIGLMLIDWPPHPAHPLQDKRGYVLNVYVDPGYRRRGIARKLMQLADDAFAERKVSYAILHATAQATPLYAGLGWAGTSEMARALHGNGSSP